MIKLLYISPYPVHKNVAHAGGQLFYYYFKKFTSDKEFEVGFILPQLYENMDYLEMLNEFPQVHNFSATTRLTLYSRLKHFLNFNWIKTILLPILKFIHPIYFINPPSYRWGIKHGTKRVWSKNWMPDIIIHEFTEALLYARYSRQMFPNAKHVVVEHDINFQGLSRKYPSKIYKYSMKKFKRLELAELSRVDAVFTLNEKDKLLLDSEGISRSSLFSITPFYQSYKGVGSVKKNGILFFGALGRIENKTAVEWFLMNVWTKISERFPELIFYVIGGGLSEIFKKKYSIKNVCFTGFVENPGIYFSKSYCAVAPLRLGAGIKIKVLEAMAFGLPVLTNDIGIEGIKAERGIEYLHCETEDDFFNSISQLVSNASKAQKISKQSKAFVDENFNLLNSYTEYKQKLTRLL